MKKQSVLQVSQDLLIVPPKRDRAYPIPCEEWELLKRKISRLGREPWLFQNVGSLLLGTSLSAFVSSLTGTFDLPALYIAWSASFVTLVCGILSWVCAVKEIHVHRERATDLVERMETIEKRYTPPCKDD